MIDNEFEDEKQSLARERQEIEGCLLKLGLLGKSPADILTYFASHERLFASFRLYYQALLGATNGNASGYPPVWCAFCRRSYVDAGPLAEGPNHEARKGTQLFFLVLQKRCVPFLSFRLREKPGSYCLQPGLS